MNPEKCPDCPADIRDMSKGRWLPNPYLCRCGRKWEVICGREWEKEQPNPYIEPKQTNPYIEAKLDEIENALSTIPSPRFMFRVILSKVYQHGREQGLEDAKERPEKGDHIG